MSSLPPVVTAPLAVVIDASPLLAPHAGIGRYTDQLIRALAPAPDLALRLMCSYRPRAARGFAELASDYGALGAQAFLNPVPNRILQAGWEFTGAPPVEWFAGQPTVFHATNHLAPPARRARVVATVHDLTALRFPDWHQPYQRVVARYMAKSLARTDRVIAVSEATAHDLKLLFGVPEEKISVIPLAAAQAFHTPGDPTTVAARYGLAGPYYMFVGTLEPRKNVRNLLKAYRELPGDIRGRVDLVLAGGRGWESQETLDLLGATPGARWLGRVPDADLPALLAGSLGFVYPSRYEGFGLPVLEAMAAGAPVITSDVSSMPEVAGDAALLVSPDDVEGLAAAMARLAETPALRERLRSLGRARARAFSWERTARATRAVYRDLAP